MLQPAAAALPRVARRFDVHACLSTGRRRGSDRLAERAPPHAAAPAEAERAPPHAMAHVEAERAPTHATAHAEAERAPPHATSHPRRPHASFIWQTDRLRKGEIPTTAGLKCTALLTFAPRTTPVKKIIKLNGPPDCTKGPAVLAPPSCSCTAPVAPTQIQRHPEVCNAQAQELSKRTYVHKSKRGDLHFLSTPRPRQRAHDMQRTNLHFLSHACPCEHSRFTHPALSL